MALTKMENMINPEVMGPMINAKIEALAKLTPYARIDTTLQGVPGDTKTIPSWKYIGDADDVAEGEEVGLTTLQASSTTFTIKKAMKAVGITQEAVNSGLGNPIGQAELQLANPSSARWTTICSAQPIPPRISMRRRRSPRSPTTALWRPSRSSATRRTTSTR